MARLPILEYPDPRLRIRAEPVTRVDADIRRFVEDLFETMYTAPGIGLAATQVNIHKRILVCDISADGKEPYCFINPELVSAEGTTSAEEGCLSVPEFYDYVERAAKVRVRALDRDGKPFELEAEGLLAVAIQHETDHLNGVVMLDKLNAVKRRLLGRKLAREKNDAAEI